MRTAAPLSTIRSPLALALMACAAVLVLQIVSTGERADPRGAAPVDRLAAGRSHDYRLDDYRTILRRARGVVGVARRGAARPFATGIVVAPDRVLTCRHATHVHSASSKRLDPGRLEVQLRSEDGHGPQPARSFPVLGYAHTSESVDLCVLHVGPDARGSPLEEDRVLRLSSQRTEPGAPIYVVHHPKGGPLRVADDARVLFPFRATDAEIHGIAERLRCEIPDEEAAARAIDLMRRGYGCTSTEGAGPFRRNHSLRWAGQPVLGVDCRTRDGSSGAAVFDKRTHALVGMVFAGVNQTRQRVPSTWRHHEAVLPAVAILEDLRRASGPACRELARGAVVAARGVRPVGLEGPGADLGSDGSLLPAAPRTAREGKSSRARVPPRSTVDSAGRGEVLAHRSLPFPRSGD